MDRVITSKKSITPAIAAIIAVLTSLIITLLLSSTAFAVTQADVDSAKAQLEAADSEAQQAAETYYQALDAHDAAVAAMDDAQQRIDDATAKIAANQERLKSRAVAMYRSGSPTLMDVFFASTSFKDFANTWTLLTDLNESDANLISETKDLKAQAQQAYEDYAVQEKEAADQLAASETAKADVEAKAAQYQSVYDGLSADLQAQVAADAAAAEAATTTATTTSGNSSSGSSGDGGYLYGGGGITCSVSLALAQVGKPYVWATAGPDTFDCSGLCYYCGAPAHGSDTLYAIAKSRLPISEAQPGDVLWKSGHVGIYIGNGEYVNAVDPANGVKVGSNMGQFTYVLRF